MSYTRLFYHIVFSTKNRRPFLDDVLLPRVCQYMGGIIRNHGGQLLAADGVADHVHLCALLKPTVALADLVRDVKAGASGWVHDEFPDRLTFFWQDGYAAFSVSKSVVPDVTRHIRGQRAHHSKQTFQEELIALLEAHEVEYDPKHIWT